MDQHTNLKINFGCGHRIWPGYFNIDAVRAEKAPSDPELLYEMQFDADGNLVNPVPLENGCAVELTAIHVFEHFHRWTSESVIREWRRLLAPGGKLILELPDLIKCCKNIVEGRQGRHPDQLGRWGLYGDPRDKNKFMCHPWGWAPDELMQLLKQNGFASIKHLPTKFHSIGRDHRDMRIEAVKA